VWQRSSRIALATLAVSLPLSISGSQIALGALLLLSLAAGPAALRRVRGAAATPPLVILLVVLGISTVAGGPSWAALDAYRSLWVVGTYVVVLACSATPPMRAG
jgi:hypothetical protein